MSSNYLPTDYKQLPYEEPYFQKNLANQEKLLYQSAYCIPIHFQDMLPTIVGTLQDKLTLHSLFFQDLEDLSFAGLWVRRNYLESEKIIKT